MRFLIAGASGFLGTALRQNLIAAGHDVTALVRRPPGPGRLGAEAQWDPYTGRLDLDLVEKADVVVNLAGAPTLGNPHSKKWADDLRSSRVTTTRVLADAIASSQRRPAFLAGNGIAYYGDHGDQPVDEGTASVGDAFLTGVTHEWQAAAEPAAEAGARVCVLRTSPVMDRSNPPLKQQLLLFRSGLGGRIGSGRQYMPMVSLRDWVAAVTFLGTHDDVSGPVNLCCPQTPTNAEFTSALGHLVHRPTLFTAPAPIVRRASGRMAPELLGSVRAVPRVLLDAGFEFADPAVDDVLGSALGD